jgi:hypothetical protein
MTPLYPIWQPLPRPRHFPRDRRLNELLASYFDPDGKGFTLHMQRRNARDLRKGMFGPRGLKKVPGVEGGEMTFGLPNGWALRLDYDEVEPVSTPERTCIGGPNRSANT